MSQPISVQDIGTRKIIPQILDNRYTDVVSLPHNKKKTSFYVEENYVFHPAKL